MLVHKGKCLELQAIEAPEPPEVCAGSLLDKRVYRVPAMRPPSFSLPSESVSRALTSDGDLAVVS